MKVEQLGLELVWIWDICTAVGDFTRDAAVLAAVLRLFKQLGHMQVFTEALLLKGHTEAFTERMSEESN